MNHKSFCCEARPYVWNSRPTKVFFMNLEMCHVLQIISGKVDNLEKCHKLIGGVFYFYFNCHASWACELAM
jgi:hypothetical protein